MADIRATVVSDGSVLLRQVAGAPSAEDAGLLIARTLQAVDLGSVRSLPTKQLVMAFEDGKKATESSPDQTREGMQLQVALKALGVDNAPVHYVDLSSVSSYYDGQGVAVDISPEMAKVIQARSKAQKVQFGESVEEVPIEALVPMHEMPRYNVDSADIQKLVDQIRVHGFDVSNPIELMRMPNGDLLIRSGHDRTFAMKALDEKTIPARIDEYSDVSPQLAAKTLRMAEAINGYRVTVYPTLTPAQEARISEYVAEEVKRRAAAGGNA